MSLEVTSLSCWNYYFATKADVACKYSLYFEPFVECLKYLSKILILRLIQWFIIFNNNVWLSSVLLIHVSIIFFCWMQNSKLFFCWKHFHVWKGVKKIFDNLKTSNIVIHNTNINSTIHYTICIFMSNEDTQNHELDNGNHSPTYFCLTNIKNQYLDVFSFC